MLPAIGSISTLASQGRVGIVVGARPIGEAEGGRQLVALRIKSEEPRSAGAAADRSSGMPAGSNAGRFDTNGPAALLPQDGPSRSAPAAAKLPDQLSPAEKSDVARLQQRDQQVRQEEKAHAAVAGDLAGPINYVYRRGPDGRQYAVGGSVGIQAATVGGDPAEARRLSGRIAAAANAATNPSAQDYATARQAYAFGSQLADPASEAQQRPERSLML